MTCECGHPTLPGSHLCWGCRDAALNALRPIDHLGGHNSPGSHVGKRAGSWSDPKPPKPGRGPAPPSVRYAANLDRMLGRE